MSASTGFEIAVIGLAGRFPGAADLTAFWRNLCAGVEAVTRFSPAQLRARGVPAEVLADPNYVPAGVVLEGMDQFDAGLFDYSAREALYLDPQQRVFLECAWQALEHAGYLQPVEVRGPRIGVYAGEGANLYLLRQVLPTVGSSHDIADLLALSNGSSPGALCTRVAYKLNLRGPAVSVQTECSTSLVAVHLACTALLSHECDVAIAGGVWLNLMQELGYRYQSGAILASDGHCRAFDAQADGTVIGSGAGVVVLKRLSEALHDGDTIHAVIKGSAINNDGADKVGFTAPSVRGQTSVIQAALAMAGVEARSIGYVEAHGTGTQLGDPIELAALREAFGAGERNSCAVGSVKTNIGHLDAAAGVVGLIKAILALEHALIPPSLNFRTANPQIDFGAGPFYVNTATRPWPTGSTPRRAAVSSFGIGGTNAHVVLEQAPLPLPRGAAGVHVLRLAARSVQAVAVQLRELAEHLEQHPEVSLAAADDTLRVGRRRFSERAVVLGRTHDEVIAALRTGRYFQGRSLSAAPSVAWLFGDAVPTPGVLEHPLLRSAVEQCVRLQPAALQRAPSFVIQYALAQLWRSWELKPEALLGCGSGAYVAACMAGVLTLEQALRLLLEPATQLPTLRAPACPLVSSLTGEWLRPAQAQQAGQWQRESQTRTLPAAALATLLARPDRVLLACGAAELHHDARLFRVSLNTTDLEAELSSCVAQLWTAGIEASPTTQPRRVALPTYPFERQSYWLGAATTRELADWGYVPCWRRASIPATFSLPSGCTLVVAELNPFTTRLLQYLREQGIRVVHAQSGAAFAALGSDAYRVRPTERADYSALIEQLATPVSHVCHLLSLGDVADPLQAGFYSVHALAQALVSQGRPVALSVVSDGLEDVSGLDALQPVKAALHGVCRVLPLEHDTLSCRVIDVRELATPRDLAQLAAWLYDTRALSLVALRGAHAWLKHYEPQRLETGTPRLRRGGVYLITGGLGGVGLALARYLAQQWQARLVLLSRTASAEHAAVHELQAAGATPLVLQADVTDAASLGAALQAVRARFGTLHGVIHAAGVAGGGLLARRAREAMAAVLAPKIAGTQKLLEALRAEPLDFVLLCSSLSAITGDIGQVDYCAANSVLDALATQAAQRGSPWVLSVNWDAWRATGMAGAQPSDSGMTVEQGVAVFARLLSGQQISQAVISVLALEQQFLRAAQGVATALPKATPSATLRHPRPDLTAPYLAPTAGLQQSLAALWSEFLGVSPIGVHDNLFELGGDSLLALQLLARVCDAYRVELQPAELLREPTIAALAELVELRLIEDIELSATG